MYETFVVTSIKEVMFYLPFVCSFVCLLETLCKNCRSDLHENCVTWCIFEQGNSHSILEVVHFWIRKVWKLKDFNCRIAPLHCLLSVIAPITPSALATMTCSGLEMTTLCKLIPELFPNISSHNKY